MLAQSPEGSLRRRKATDEDGPGFGTCIGSRHDHRLPRTAAQSAWQRAPGFASRTVLYLRGTGGHRGKKKEAGRYAHSSKLTVLQANIATRILACNTVSFVLCAYRPASFFLPR